MGVFNVVMFKGFIQITIKELENLLVKLKTDPKHNQLGVQGTLSPLVREEIRALLKVADKDHSGAITFGVSNFLLMRYYISDYIIGFIGIPDLKLKIINTRSFMICGKGLKVLVGEAKTREKYERSSIAWM